MNKRKKTERVTTQTKIQGLEKEAGLGLIGKSELYLKHIDF